MGQIIYIAVAGRPNTSEMKVAVITSALKKRFPGSDIVNVAGIRRQESEKRRRMPVSAPMSKLQRKGCAGLAWNAIIEWQLEDVFAIIAEEGLALHEAYTVYNASRVSCAFCIMSALKDLVAASNCADNRDLYVQMVELEAKSAFSFQPDRWLADVAPQLLPADLLRRIEWTKTLAEMREGIEAELPSHLLYKSGWPTAMPTPAEAELIASVRRRVSLLMNLKSDYLTADAVMARYAELLAAKALAGMKRAPRTSAAPKQAPRLRTADLV